MPKPAAKGSWIRSQPRDLPFDELQKRAKQAGIGAISRTYATKIRSSMPTPANHSNSHAASSPADTWGAQFLKCVRVIGTERARRMLDLFENGGA